MESHPHPPHPNDVVKALVDVYGEVVGGKALHRCLGFRSTRSFQRALQAGNLPVQTFLLPGRRGRFARTRDIALWVKQLGQKPELADVMLITDHTRTNQ